MRDLKLFKNRRRLLEAIRMSAVAWALLYLCAILFDARWPQGHTEWENFVLLGTVAETIWIKTWFMYSRSSIITRLGASLISFNFVFVYVYFTLGNILPLWPEFALEHPAMVSYAMRLPVIAVCIWAVYEMARTEDPMPVQGA